MPEQILRATEIRETKAETQRHVMDRGFIRGTVHSLPTGLVDAIVVFIMDVFSIVVIAKSLNQDGKPLPRSTTPR